LRIENSRRVAVFVQIFNSKGLTPPREIPWNSENIFAGFALANKTVEQVVRSAKCEVRSAKCEVRSAITCVNKSLSNLSKNYHIFLQLSAQNGNFPLSECKVCVKRFYRIKNGGAAMLYDSTPVTLL
jgi:hypothetical protein